VGSVVRRWVPGRVVDPQLVLSGLRRGGGDPTYGFDRGTRTVWRATRTPDGPVTLRLTPLPGLGEIEAEAWGPGAEWALDGVPELLGERDRPEGFRPLPEHLPLVRAARRFGHYRVPRTRAVFEAMAGAGIEQVVTGQEAFRAWRLLVREYGEPAPGPTNLAVPPSPQEWRLIPSWQWLRAGVDGRRSRVVITAARKASALERTLALDDGAEVERRLRSLPGVGVWTAAEVRQRAHGDADAFSFADYHVSRNVSYALTGEEMDDDGCAELIEPYRGHRFRVQRLLELAGIGHPRRGPRRALPTHTPGARRR